MQIIYNIMGHYKQKNVESETFLFRFTCKKNILSRIISIMQ